MKIVIQYDDGTVHSEHDFPGDDASIVRCVAEGADDCMDATLPEDMGLTDKDWYRGTYLMHALYQAGDQKPVKRTLKEHLADYEIE